MTPARRGKPRLRQGILALVGVIALLMAVFVEPGGLGSHRAVAAASVLQGYGDVSVDLSTAQDAANIPTNLNGANGSDLWLVFAKGNEVRNKSVTMIPPAGFIFVSPTPSSDVYFRCSTSTWQLSSNVVATPSISPSGTVDFTFSNTGNNACSYALVVGATSPTWIQPVSATNPPATGGEVTLMGTAGLPTLDTAPITSGVARITVLSKTPSTTSVSCEPNPVIAGQPSTCTATVASDAGAPEGTVHFASDGDGTFSNTSCDLAAGECPVDYTPASAGSTPHTVTATYVPSSNHQGSQGDDQVEVLVDGDGDGVADSVDQCPGTETGATVDDAGCPARIIRIIKLAVHAEGGTPPAAVFEGTISPHAPGSWSIDTSTSAVVEIDGVFGSTVQTVVESEPGASWTFSGYWRGEGLLSDCAGATFDGARQVGVAVPGDGLAYTVCIRNVYTPPTGNIIIRKAVDPDAARDGAAFAFDFGTLSGGRSPLGHGDEVTFAGVEPGSYTVSETNLPDGWTVAIACSGDLDGGSAVSGSSVTIDLDADETIDCTFANTHVSRTVRIMKVVERAGGGDVPNATFSGTVTPGDAAWTIDTSTQNRVNAGGLAPYEPLTVIESAEGDDWLFGGYWRGEGLLSGCGGATFAGTRQDGAEIPADGQAYTVCIKNVYAPPVIVLAKVVEGELAGTADEFSIAITQTGGSFSEQVALRATDGPLAIEVTTGTFAVTEGDPSGIGAGYLPPGYSEGTIEEDGSVTCGAAGASPPEVSLVAGETAVICVHNRAARLPTVSKSAMGFKDGAATWRLTIDNTGEDTIARVVRVTDPGVTLIPAAGCSQDGADITCEVSADSSVSVDMSTHVPGQTCADRRVENQASAVAVTAAGDIDLGTAGSAAVTVPGNPDVCDRPVLSKTAAGYVDGHARWSITIDNRVEQAGRRTVVVDDPDATLVSVDGNCEPSGVGATVDGLTCRIEPNEVVTIVVGRAEPSACDARLIGNSAAAEVVLEAGGARPLQNSPTLDAFVTVPGDDAACPARITVRKLFDTDGDGHVAAPPDTPVNGWAITVACDGGEPPGSPGITGTDGAGTVVFTVPAPAGGKSCTVTEATQTLVRTVGHSINGGPLQPGGSAEVTLVGRDDVTVTFLNDPVELPAPEPSTAVDTVIPGPRQQRDDDAPDSATPEPQAPAPTPGAPPSQDDGGSGEPAATGTPSPVATPTVSPGVTATPAPPATGTGLAPGKRWGAISLTIIVAIMLAALSAHGAGRLQRRP